MRNRFHEPRSDTPSPRRLDDVNANKSLYGNKRETPSIRCHEPAQPARTRTPRAPPRSARRREAGYIGRAGRREAGYIGRAGRREAGYIGRAGRREAGYIGRAGRREAGYISRAGRRETGPLTVRHLSGVCRLGHERGDCLPGCKKSEIPVGRQDGPRRASGTRAGPRTGQRLGRYRLGKRHGPWSRGPRQAREQPEAQKSFRFRHPSPEPNTGRKRLTWEG